MNHSLCKSVLLFSRNSSFLHSLPTLMIFSPRNFSVSKNSDRSLLTAEQWMLALATMEDTSGLANSCPTFNTLLKGATDIMQEELLPANVKLLTRHPNLSIMQVI